MHIKKAGKKIIGAELTAAEKKALDIEIRRQISEYEHKHEIEIDAMILWVLHEKFGFGHKRLRQFFDAFNSSMKELHRRYEDEDIDAAWVCADELKAYGVDVEAWREEKSKCR